jgi:hypothetical protein
MTLKEQVLARVQPFNALSVAVVDRQDTRDIITGVLETHEEQKGEYDKICMLFDEPTAYDTGEKIWRFLRDNVRYNEETVEYQTLRTPAAILAPGQLWGADCKNYSLFTAGVLDALNRRGAQIPLAFRFARYDGKRRGNFTHVFVVMYPGSDDEIWVDAVLSRYDYHKQPTSYTDKKMLAKVSGIPVVKSPKVGSRRSMATMGQGDGDDGDDIYYDGGEDDIPSGDGSSGSSDSDTAGFTFSSSSTSAASQSGSDLTVNPSSGASALDPADAGNFAYNASTGQYEPVNAEGQNTVVDANAGSSSSSGNFFSSLLNAITGGGSGSGTGSSGGSGSSLSTGKSGTSSQPSNSSTPVVINSGSNNTVLYVIGGVVVLGLIIALNSKNK